MTHFKTPLLYGSNLTLSVKRESAKTRSHCFTGGRKFCGRYNDTSRKVCGSFKSVVSWGALEPFLFSTLRGRYRGRYAEGTAEGTPSQLTK